MKEEQKLSSMEFGVYMCVGIIAIALGSDLTGRLMRFVYGEWQYVSIGLVVLAFCGISVYVHSGFNDIQWNFQKSMEEKFKMAEKQFSYINRENENLRSEIDFIKRSFEKHWELCRKTINKVDELMEQKSPIIVEAPQSPHMELDQNVQDAVQEVVGGEA